MFRDAWGVCQSYMLCAMYLSPSQENGRDGIFLEVEICDRESLASLIGYVGARQARYPIKACTEQFRCRRYCTLSALGDSYRVACTVPRVSTYPGT
jgi:hypothetical protein